MDIDKLKEAYYSKTNSEASKEIGVSVPTLLKMIDKAGIERKGSGRPYDNPNIYTSSATGFVNKSCGIKAYGLFHMLLSDKEFISNKWDGQSNVLINDNNDDRTDSLKRLFDKGFIGGFHTIDNKIVTTIINREGFVLTEDEYIKNVVGGK